MGGEAWWKEHTKPTKAKQVEESKDRSKRKEEDEKQEAKEKNCPKTANFAESRSPLLMGVGTGEVQSQPLGTAATAQAVAVHGTGTGTGTAQIDSCTGKKCKPGVKFTTTTITAGVSFGFMVSASTSFDVYVCSHAGCERYCYADGGRIGGDRLKDVQQMFGVR